MRIVIILVFLVGIFGVVSCENMFDYSPYAIDFTEENRNVNQRNIGNLAATDTDDTIKIAFTGDTHRFFDEFDGFAKDVSTNHSVDFVIHVGDLADFGLPKQYQWGNSFLLKLNIPYFVVIGNHDLVGNGLTAYENMFGSLDFSFVYDQIKFIFLNTNSREFKFNGNVPDIFWLEEQLKPSEYFTKAIVIFHVSPTEGDFDPSMTEDFYSALGKYSNVLFTVHGHLHHHEIYTPNSDSIPYINVFGVEHRKYNIIRISNKQFDVETVEF